PRNGPKGVTPERAYSFTYSNVLIISLDANVAPADQTEWLEAQLANSDATWKFVTYHQPAYSSSASRNNPEVRKLWGDLFDKYHVDLALQGHDHAYLRPYPMYNEKRVATPADGTIYIVSTSGTKYYDQGKFDYTEVGFTRTNTYQVIDLEIKGDTLTYKARGTDGKVLDEFVIEK
ncbi:MAG: metallophosphoesterase, partial [Candidatus Hydrogenedentes bacterium]|nr:metallophosphoesterase [Candidatus Hydrogenedentota bacterium]